MERLKYVWVLELLERLRLVKRPAIPCREVVELVTRYLEDALPANDKARFEAHLTGCRHCTKYLEQFRQTISATGQIKEEDLAPAVKENLVAAFRNWKAG